MNNPNQINYADNSAPHAPQSSWWIRPQAGFTAHCELEQFPRMRWSKYGLRPTHTVEYAGASSAELYRMRKKMADAR